MFAVLHRIDRSVIQVDHSEKKFVQLHCYYNIYIINLSVFERKRENNSSYIFDI